jgi:hypothetical protein
MPQSQKENATCEKNTKPSWHTVSISKPLLIGGGIMQIGVFHRPIVFGCGLTSNCSVSGSDENKNIGEGKVLSSLLFFYKSSPNCVLAPRIGTSALRRHGEIQV